MVTIAPGRLRDRRFEMWIDPAGRIVHRRFRFGHWQWPVGQARPTFTVNQPRVWEVI